MIAAENIVSRGSAKPIILTSHSEMFPVRQPARTVKLSKKISDKGKSDKETNDLVAAKFK